MRPKSIAVALGMSVLGPLPLANTAQATDVPAPKVEEVRPIAEYEYELAHHVDAKDVPSLKLGAMKGSPEAAKKLAYFFGVQADWQNQAYWLSIAVENGAQDQRLDLARAYTREHTDYSKDRARFWYKKIIADGPKDMSELAAKELAAWDEYERLYDK